MSNSTEPEASVINEPPKKANIGPEERARRKTIVDYARGSVRLEGFVVTPFAEELYGRYIGGELSLKEIGAKILAHHKP